MINSKLQKGAQANNLLIEFSILDLSPTLKSFYQNCKQEGVFTKRSNIIVHQLVFHHVEKLEGSSNTPIGLKDTPTEFTFIMNVYYFNQEGQQQAIASQEDKPVQRSLFIREGLQNRFYLHYETENTISQKETLVFLCQLSSCMINCRNSSSLQFYEKRADEIKGRERENELMKFWKNVLFQVPGLGKEKCIAIASKYTTFRSLIDDYIGARELKSIAVQKGVKDIKLGSVLADRIYKCLTSSHDLQNIIQ